MKIFQSDFFQDDSLVYPSIQTSTTLTQPPSEELTSSQADSPANRSVLPGSKEARKMTVGSGRKCSELLSKHNPLGCLLKTLLASSTWHSTRCWLTWKPKTTPRGRLYFQLVPRMPSTAETESGSLPGMLGTPRATEAVRSDKFRAGRTPTPEEFVQMWPTPRATDFKGAGPRTNDQSIQKRLDNGTKNLSETVQAVQRGMWPTPSANQFETKDLDKMLQRRARAKESSGNGNGFGLTLANAARMWPTPTANEDAAGTPNGKMQRRLGNHPEVRNTGQGSLSADWVEALMGYPKGWTSLDDGETDPGKTEFPE
jgi:hypothetical protein